MSQMAQAVARGVQELRKGRRKGRTMVDENDGTGQDGQDIAPEPEAAGDAAAETTTEETAAAAEGTGDGDMAKKKTRKNPGLVAGRPKAAKAAKKPKAEKKLRVAKAPKAPRAPKAPKPEKVRDVRAGLRATPKLKGVLLGTDLSRAVVKKALEAYKGWTEDEARESQRVLLRIASRPA